jgi:hypothetical protein
LCMVKIKTWTTLILHSQLFCCGWSERKYFTINIMLATRWPNKVTTLAQQFYFVDRTLYQRWRWILVNNQWHSCMSEQLMVHLHEWTINDTAAWVNNQWHSCMSEQSMAQLHEWTINNTAAWVNNQWHSCMIDRNDTHTLSLLLNKD